MMWVGFQLAAEEVERRLGLSWGAAQKTLLEACENGKVTSRRTEDGLDVLDTEFWEWLSAKQARPPAGKVPKIIDHLAQLFPNGVPDRTRCPRKALRADLCKRDPSLHPLDEATLKKAIDTYNGNPKQS